jgi:hypothetical protein
MGPKLVCHTETKIQPKVPENRVVREYLKIRRGKEDKVGEYSVMWNVTICIYLPTSLQYLILMDPCIVV